jgi:signal transduction histidine kinase
MPIERLRRLLSEDSLLRKLPQQRTSLKRRILWHSLLLVGFTVAILSLLSIIVARSLIQNRVLDQLSSTLASRESLLTGALQFDRERAMFLAADDRVRSLLAAPDASVLRRLRDGIGVGETPVKGITLFDAAGRTIAASGETSPSPSPMPAETRLVPVLNRLGLWNATDVYVPVHSAGGSRIGVFALRYDPLPLLAVLSANPSLGLSGETQLMRREGNTVSIVYEAGGTGARHPSNIRQADLSDVPQVVVGKDGVYAGNDEWGQPVLAAYRSVPALGWGMALQVDTAEAMRGWEYFAFTLLGLDLFILLLTGVFGIALARQLSAPILSLASNMRQIKAGHWSFRRSVHTGDEVELLDFVAAELTARLRQTYEHLEEEVQERTQSLQHQFRLDRMILENLEIGVLVTDAGGSVVDANPAALRLLQTDMEKIGRQTAVQALAVFRKNSPLPESEHPVRVCLRAKEPVHTHQSDHLSVRCGDQTLLPVLISVTPLLVRGQLQSTLVLFQDMREENRVDEMKSDFIALASHQLRTPLSALRWYIELLRSEEKPKLSKDQKEFLAQIDQSSKRMANLLDDLLHVTHLEGGEITPQKRAFDLAKMFQELCAEWHPVSVQKGINCSLTLPPHSLKITSDPVLLRLVVQNLFSNALKYSPKGSGIRVQLEASGKWAVITVADSGMGIPAEAQKRIFQKFFRAKNARRADADGSGLGLYLAKVIVENLGGNISFKSAQDKGTTFTIKLPLK